MVTKDDIIKYVQHTPENTNPSVLGGLLSNLQEEKSIQSDWNQNDETKLSYIKNRPFYTGDPVENVFVEESTVSFDGPVSGHYTAEFSSLFEATAGETYKVSWDGTVYECTCVIVQGFPAIGNASIAGFGSDTGEPFLMGVLNGKGITIFTVDTSASHTFSISGMVAPVVKIDKKYLVQPDWNQNDETAADFVKNRPFYSETGNVTIENAIGEILLERFPVFAVGDTVTVNVDGVEHSLVAYDDEGIVTIGDTYISINSGEGQLGWQIFVAGDEVLFVSLETHTVSYLGVDYHHKIDKKYLPTYTAGEIGAQPDMYVARFDGVLEGLAAKTVVYAASAGSASPIPSGRYPVLFMRGEIDRGNASIVAYDAAGKTWSGNVNFAQGKIWLTERTLTPFKPDGKSYLTFSSPSSFTLAVNDATKHWNGTLEYFASDRTWAIWDGTSALSAVANGGEYALYLRGTRNTVITGNSTEYKWVLTGTDIRCIGNIDSLLDYATVESGGHPTMAEYCYADMFCDCTSLTEAPALPATTLASNCYRNMFKGCTSLTEAPALPATTLASSCYYTMFFGCTSLTEAPALPATKMADYCYDGMFYGCTSLTEAPALPATTLADYCYANMFIGCTSLTEVPALPATRLVSGCYLCMFQGCTSLKLSSTQTDKYTQEYRIPSSGNGTTSINALERVFYSTGGTFKGTPKINTTYYLSSDNMIARETDIATLNGYVGSMIDVAIEEYADTAEYIIHSSTEGSTKKFKITVDDSGTISATEYMPKS